MKVSGVRMSDAMRTVDDQEGTRGYGVASMVEVCGM